MSKYLTFKCGCQFPILDDRGIENNQVINEKQIFLPRINVDIYNLPLDCPSTWDLFATGQTRGVWQLETPLGQSWSAKLKPRSIEELAALTAMLRPGMLNAFTGDPPKSMTQKYVDRKNGAEIIESLHPELDNILKNTYGILCFQEQSIKIVQKLAGFSLIQSELLRKSLGKKLPELMQKVKIQFLEGCKQTNLVDEKIAEEIFSWIKAGERYSFNLSHSVEYAILAYQTAYMKAHFPAQFIAAYLKGAKWKQDTYQEIYDFIQEAKSLEIPVYTPNINVLKPGFVLQENSEGIDEGIYYGFTDIKGVGISNFNSFCSAINEDRPTSWLQYLINTSHKVDKTTNTNFIKCGIFDFLNETRTKMLFEYECWSEKQNITEKEKEWIRQNCQSFTDLGLILTSAAILKRDGGAVHNQNRLTKLKDLINLLNNPPVSLEDKAHWLSFEEEKLLGVSLTYDKMQNITNKSNTTCRAFLNGEILNPLILTVEIKRVKNIITKKNSNMCFVDVADTTGQTSLTVFPKQYIKYKDMLQIGQIITCYGHRDSKTSSLIVDKVEIE